MSCVIFKFVVALVVALLLLLLEKSDGIRPTFIFVKRKRGNKQNAKQKRERRREYSERGIQQTRLFVRAGV